jgi:hypothetical protein
MKQADIRHTPSEGGDITHFAAVAATDQDIVHFHAPPPAAYFSTVTVTSSRGRSPYSFWPLN